jgi:sugar-phosphatase
MDCRAILFDLDGVLIDSTSCVERHWNTWARKHGLDVDHILRIAHGVRNIDTMRLIVPHLDVEEEARQFAADEVVDTAGVVPVDGASTVLATLAGAAWAVVTSCGADLARARMDATHLPPPPVLITGTDVARGKPEPDPYLLAARQLGVRSEDCVVVEDAPAGIQAGKKAGMRVIGVAFTYGREDLLAEGADVAVDRLSSLKIRHTHGTLSIVAEAA